MWPLSTVALCLICLSGCGQLRAAEEVRSNPGRRPASLTIRCLDADTGATLPAWAIVVGPDGKRVESNDDPELFVVSNNSFLFEKSYTLPVPDGRLAVAAERGFDYAIGRKTVDIGHGANQVTIQLKRIADPRAHGWYCAPAHIHMQVSKSNPKYSHETIVDMMSWWPAAGGYDILINHAMGVGEESLPSTVWGWNADYFPAGRWHPPHGIPYDTLYDMGEEFRANPEGHVLFWNLQSYVEPGSAGSESYLPGRYNVPLVADAGQECVDQGGYFAFAHTGGGNSLEVSVCLGQCSAINMGDLAFVYDRWYRLLNAGFRVSVVAGPDFIFTNGARFYAKVRGEFSWKSWMNAVRRGRTFATSGPLLFATVNGLDPGEELRLDEPGDVQVRVEAVSKHTFEAIQIVVNGEIIRTVATEGDRRSVNVDTTIPIGQSSWIGVRTIGHPGEEMVWEDVDDPAVRPRFMRQSHTTPVYCLVGDRALGSVGALNEIAHWNEVFFRDWIEKTARFPDESDRRRALEHFSRAQRVIEGMIEKRQRPRP